MRKDMLLGMIERLSAVETEVRWCSDRRLDEENAPGVSPGDHLNRFGWTVIGTTIGGNAIVVRGDDFAVYFADHTWYSDQGISFQDFNGTHEWTEAPLSAAGVRQSLFRLAASIDDFAARAASGEMDRILDRID